MPLGSTPIEWRAKKSGLERNRLHYQAQQQFLPTLKEVLELEWLLHSLNFVWMKGPLYSVIHQFLNEVNPRKWPDARYFSAAEATPARGTWATSQHPPHRVYFAQNRWYFLSPFVVSFFFSQNENIKNDRWNTFILFWLHSIVTRSFDNWPFFKSYCLKELWRSYEK